MSARIGWYLLRSGTPFYGEVPPGVELIDPPATEPVPVDEILLDRPKASAKRDDLLDFAVQAASAAFGAELRENLAGATKADLNAFLDDLEQGVDPAEHESTVGPEVAGVDLSTEPLEVDSAPPAGDGADEELDSDEQVVGHEA